MNINSANNQLTNIFAQISSGKRINSAKDDAAGLAISDRMTSQINGVTPVPASEQACFASWNSWFSFLSSGLTHLGFQFNLQACIT